MSELLVAAIKVMFLALLWLFILFAANVIRTDMFGRTVTTEEVADRPPAALTRKPARRRRASKTIPKHLSVSAGRQQGTVFDLTDQMRLGRGTDCELLIDDDYASTHHASLTLGSRGYVLEDLGSTNGTHVNGARITTPTLVTPDDSIRIGRTVMALEK